MCKLWIATTRPSALGAGFAGSEARAPSTNSVGPHGSFESDALTPSLLEYVVIHVHERETVSGACRHERTTDGTVAPPVETAARVYGRTRATRTRRTEGPFARLRR
jgi:hypothetical protein